MASTGAKVSKEKELNDNHNPKQNQNNDVRTTMKEKECDESENATNKNTIVTQSDSTSVQKEIEKPSLNDNSTMTTNTNPSMDSLLSLSFNQDGGCLAVGTTSGFRIYNVFPFQETFRRTFDSVSGQSPKKTTNQTNGIGIVEMLFRCNLLALVGGGPSPKYPTNKVMIWDDHRGRCIGELSFRQKVLSVKLRRDRVAVALIDRVYVYNFSDLTLLDQIHTTPNPLGLLSFSPDAGTATTTGATGLGVGMVLACPSINQGGVRVELYGCRKTVLIDAHETSLAALALSLNGTLLATASERGTLIRLFSTKDKNGTLLRELRRGVERANISCIAFSMQNTWLATTSDRGTTHIFYLGENNNNMSKYDTYNTQSNKNNSQMNPASQSTQPKLKSLLSSSTKFLKSKRILWEGEGSYAQIRGIDDPVVCAFIPDRPMTIAIVGKTDGSILLADFSDGSGEAKRVAYHRFIKGSREKSLNHLSPATGDGNSVQKNDSNKIGHGSKMDFDFREDDICFGEEDVIDGFVTVKKTS